MTEELQAEVERLRAEVEANRQRELASLKEALAAAVNERDHYRSEAVRLDQLGRAIAAEHERVKAELETQIDMLKNGPARELFKRRQNVGGR